MNFRRLCAGVARSDVKTTPYFTECAVADEKTETPEFKPLCIWCSAPWSDDNVQIEIEAEMDGYESTGFYCTAEGTVSIVCHACKREMYRKEGVSRGW
jgi:hypothetical protein